MTSDDPKVGIVVLNWNKKDYLLNLLHSLQKIEYGNFDITVVDNASTDGSAEAVKEQFPHIDILVNSINLGCGGGLNTGMRYVADKESYEYIWLLDNDVEIEIYTLRRLINVLESDEKIGICGCALFDYHNKNFLVDCGSLVNRKAHSRGFSGENYDLPSDPFEVDFVVSASAVVRTRAAQEVNFIDQRYFFEWDDIDFCISLKEKDYKVVSVPAARVYHKPFLPGERSWNPYYVFRNRALFISKHLSFWNKIKAFYPVVREMAKIYAYSCLQNRKDDANKIKLALRDFMNNKWGEREFTRGNNWSEGITFSELRNKLNYNKKTRIIVFPSGNRDEIDQLLSELSQAREDSRQNWEVYLFIQEKRVPLIKVQLADEVIAESFSNTRFPVITRISSLLKILFHRFDIAIDTATHETMLYYYTTPKVYKWDSKTNLFHIADENIYKIWKLPLAFILGEIGALLILPLVFIKSFSYREKNR